MDKKDGWVQLTPKTFASLYQNKPYNVRSVTVNGQELIPKKVVIDDLLNTLEDMRDDFVEQAVEASKLKDANEVIAYIKSKL